MTRLETSRVCMPVRVGLHLACGFTLVEMAVSLVVIGLLASASAASMGWFKNGARLDTDAQLTSLSESVMVFARTRQRLPCPDTAGTGYEALGGPDATCTAGSQVGWLPYVSMGLSQPSGQARAIYGVYRNPVADLAISAAPAVLSLAAVQAVSGTYVYLTGDGTTTNGAENCLGNVVSNPAFVILAPGQDLDGDGLQVDGIHRTLPASGRCFAAPTRGEDASFDDRTIAVSSYAVMARLNQ